MAAASPVGREKVEVPAAHVHGFGSGREAESDQGTVNSVKRMDNLLRLDHFRQGAIRRLLLGLAADCDALEPAVHARGKYARGAIRQGVERRLELLERLPRSNLRRSLRLPSNDYCEWGQLRGGDQVRPAVDRAAIHLPIEQHHLSVHAVECAESEAAVPE